MPLQAALQTREHGGRVFYEATWRHDGHVVKRRVGLAWLEPDGRPRRGRVQDGYFDERAAHVRAAQLVAEHAVEAEAKAVKGSEPTFREVAHAYLDWLEKVRGAKPSTLKDHRSTLGEPSVEVRRGRGKTNGRIMAAFGDRPAADVTTRDVEQMLAKVAATGVGPRTVNKYREVTSAVFNHGIDPASGFELATNPAAATHKRRLPQRSALAYYAPADIGALAKACDDPQDAELMRVAAFTGLRMGELLALRWGDIDFKGDALTVSRAMSASVETGTKSGQVRQVPLAGQAASALKRLRNRGDFTGAQDLVFCNVWGRPLDGSALRRRFKVARDAAKLRDLRFHDLRHTYGSLLAADGVDLVTIKDAMGHSSLTTTNRYLHARPASTAAKRFTKAFSA